MFPPCLRPLVLYQTETNAQVSPPNSSDVTPFTPLQISFIFTELIENDLYSNVKTQDWVQITARLNSVFHTRFSFQDIRHHTLRVVLQSFITWIRSNLTRVNCDLSPATFSLVAFYYLGVLLHSAIKEGQFDLLSSASLIFPDPVYEFHMDTGFIPPTRRTIHGPTGDVTIHNPTQLSKKFEPQRHSNSPFWSETNQHKLISQHPNHPNHQAVPFLQDSSIFLPANTNIKPFTTVLQDPQQYITIHNTTANPTNGLSPWGGINMDTIDVKNAPSQDIPSARHLSGPYLTPKTLTVHLFDHYDGVNSSNTHIGPYDHLTQPDSNSTLTQKIEVPQITKYFPPLHPQLYSVIMKPSIKSAEYYSTAFGLKIMQTAPQSTVRNNFILKHTFSREWIRTHRDRYGDLGPYLVQKIGQFNMYMSQKYPQHYSNSVKLTPNYYNSAVSTVKTTTTTTTTTVTTNGINNDDKLKRKIPSNDSKEFYPQPYCGFNFGDDWSNDVNNIPDCRSQRLFNPIRNAGSIRITPTQSWANVVGSLSQPIISGMTSVANPIDTPIRHPLFTQESMFPEPSEELQAQIDTMYSSQPIHPDIEPMSIRRSIRSQPEDFRVVGYYDDGWYTNNSFVYQISLPYPPMSLFPPDDLTNPHELPIEQLLHFEESRFYFILQQKLALYFTRRGLRRAYLQLFYHKFIQDPRYDFSLGTTDTVSTSIMSSLVPLVALQATLNPMMEARQYALGRKWDERIPPIYNDILLKLTHLADQRTSLGLNLTLLSRLNFSHFVLLFFHSSLSSFRSTMNEVQLSKLQPSLQQKNQAGEYGYVTVGAPIHPFVLDLFRSLDPATLMSDPNDELEDNKIRYSSSVPQSPPYGPLITRLSAFLSLLARPHFHQQHPSPNKPYNAILTFDSTYLADLRSSTANLHHKSNAFGFDRPVGSTGFGFGFGEPRLPTSPVGFGRGMGTPVFSQLVNNIIGAAPQNDDSSSDSDYNSSDSEPPLARGGCAPQ
jgi:hypothetical protein